jgi:3-oxoacyl-[acyl-carrier protein] reductase
MRNVLVTGASRGLGLGIAQRLVAQGYRVIAIARSASEEMAQWRSKAAPEAQNALVFQPFDLAQTEKMPALVAQVRKEHGPIYGLVNNAGISFEGALAMMPGSQIEQIIQVNVLAPILLTKHVVKGMLSAGEGRIVNVSSIVAWSGYSGLAAYGASKSAMVGFTKSLAREVGRMGVTVNAVAPGFIDTDLTKKLKEEDRDRIVRRSALRRLAQVEDVAGAVEYLLGDLGKNISGTVMTVDAGSTA